MEKHDVKALFDKLRADSNAFFEQVAEDVDWTVEGSHPLAGHYSSKAEFMEHTIAKLARVLPEGAKLSVEHVLVDGDWAAVELRSDVLAKNGMQFKNRYCWVCRFQGRMIIEVRAYLDSAMVAELFRENPLRDVT